MRKISNPIEDIIKKELIKSGIKNRSDLDSFKRKVAKKYKIPCPSNIELLLTYRKLIGKKGAKKSKTIERLLQIRPIRSLSGIVNVSLLTKPYPCPGKCIFCPTQKGIPKSYLEKEPAVQRAILNRFNPYLQVNNRLNSLKNIGHPIDKIELRIIGGTWSYYPKNYQTWFVKECFRAANNFPNKVTAVSKIGKTKLEKLQNINKEARCRIVGITIETRPDFIDVKEIKRLRKLGVTGVELGVQTLYDDILKLNKRGHKVFATMKATRLLKDAGFKVSHQMMLNLPGSDFKRDVQIFQELFSNPDFKPDLLKIYPLALVKESNLYQTYYKRGEFKPYNEEKLLKLLIEIKKHIPYWCRIQRIIRDIPSEYIIMGGTKVSNLREVVQKEMQKRGLKCKCIRCREVKGDYNPKEKLYLFREDYEASEGREIFLSFESKEDKRSKSKLKNTDRKLYALLRLRIPSQIFSKRKHFVPVLNNSAIIREVHTYGQMSPLGAKPLSAQHRGLGKKLIKEAEKISREEFGLKKIAVISGVGVRQYYKKLGYKLKDTYMVKNL